MKVAFLIGGGRLLIDWWLNMTGILSMAGILNSVNIPGILSKGLEHYFVLF